MSTRTEPGLSHRRALAALLALTALAYVDALGGSFQFDDYNAIVDSPVVHDLGAWWDDAVHGLRPLLKLSYTLNWLASPQASSFVLVNVLIHLGNAVLVYFLALEWQRGVIPRSEATRDLLNGSLAEPALSPVEGLGMTRAALIAALLFALHPAQTEAVTYVCGRSVSLMTLFYLAALLAYARDRRAASLALFACALATKEVAATFPVALLVWEATRAEEFRWREAARKHWPYWALLVVVALAALVLRSKYREFFEVSLIARTPWENLLAQAGGIVWLLGQWLAPFALNIDPDLPQPAQLMPAIALQGAALLAAFALGLASIRRRPLLALALLWLFVHLAPTNSILPRLDVANDRQLYLPAIGMFIAAGVVLERSRAVWPRAVAALGVVLCVALGALTARRNLDYASEIALWQQTVTLSPQKARVHNNLAWAYRLAGCGEEARAEFARALELDPRYQLARNNLDRIERELRLGIAGAKTCGG